MDIFTIITLLIVISAAFSYVNQKVLKLPGTIGVMTISVVVSIIVLIIGKVSNIKTGFITTLAHNIDFSKLLLDVMLGFLLFATALHFDYKKLKNLRLPVILLSTVGVLISVTIFSALFYGASILLKIEIPYIYCLLFGAIISPTDPIAVAALMSNSKIPPHLATIISGESMFNDAVGLILFVTILGLATQTQPDVSVKAISILFVHEVIGGVLIGLIGGYAGYRLIRSIGDFQTIFLISISLVLGIAFVASKLAASVPLAAITAGLIIGNKNFSKSTDSQNFLHKIWQLIDEVLNTILFVMIGLELIIMPSLQHYWLIALLSIVIILLARFLSVSLPGIFLLGKKTNIYNLFIITWAGLRGGISIAMALSIPPSKYKEIILAVCYIIVIFSIIVQGLSLNRLVNRIEVKTSKATTEKL